MSGIDFVFNRALGEVKTLAALPATNDALVVVLLQATGLDADDTLRDFDDLAALLAANAEASWAGGAPYARLVRTTGIVPTVDDTNNRLDIDITTDFTWAAATAGQTIAKLLICYDPDTTTGTDSTIIPLTAHNYDEITSGSSITAEVATAGFYRAAG